MTIQLTKILDILCDMDGVLVDFDSMAVKVAGFRPSDDPTEKKARQVFWAKINAHVTAGNKFFELMDPMPDAQVLWDYIKHHNTRICTAAGSVHPVIAAKEKRIHVEKHYGTKYAHEAIVVRDSADKALQVVPGRILIDDRMKSIQPWRDAGGIGILHTSAADTIAQLEELLK